MSVQALEVSWEAYAEALVVAYSCGCLVNVPGQVALEQVPERVRIESRGHGGGRCR